MATIKTTSKKTTPENTASTTEEPNSSVASNQESYEVIQQAAYFIAEKNDFSGDAVSYWLEAEAQIKGTL